MAAGPDDLRRGPISGRGYLEFMKFSRGLKDISRRFFFDKPIGGLRDMFDLKTSFDPKVLGDVLAMRMGRSVAGTVRSVHARFARRPDDGPLHAIRGFVALRIARRSVRNRQHANR